MFIDVDITSDIIEIYQNPILQISFRRHGPGLLCQSGCSGVGVYILSSSAGYNCHLCVAHTFIRYYCVYKK